MSLVTIGNFDVKNIASIIVNNIQTNIYNDFIERFNQIFEKVKKSQNLSRTYVFTSLTFGPAIAKIFNSDVEFRPLYDMTGKGYNIVFGIVGTVLSIIVFSEIGSSALITLGSAIKAFIDVGNKYGYSDTIISLVGFQVPIHLTVKGAHLSTANIYNDFDSAYKGIQNALDFVLLLEVMALGIVIFTFLDKSIN